MNRERERERERERVGHGDFIDLIWVELDLATATLEDAQGEPLLELERNHVCVSLFDKMLSFSFALCVCACVCVCLSNPRVAFVITSHHCPLFGCQESGGNGRKMMFA